MSWRFAERVAAGTLWFCPVFVKPAEQGKSSPLPSEAAWPYNGAPARLLGGWVLGLIVKNGVLVFGSINTDFVTYVADLPAPGETVTGGRFASFPGGKGANQAVAAARSGAVVEVYGCVGDDALGVERLRGLAEAGVLIEHVVVRSGVHSGIAQIMVDAGGENLIAVAPGANWRFCPEDVVLPADAGGNTVALFQNEVPQSATEAVIASCRAKGMTVVWNVAPVGPETPPAATLAAVDFLICNRRELAGLAGAGEIEDRARRLLDHGGPGDRPRGHRP